MGTWNTKINSNDTFLDIYQAFFDLYNEGEAPANISKQIQNNFSAMFYDYDDKHNSLFALALAQWETKSLDEHVFKRVKEIIETGNDLDMWRELGADEKLLAKRKKELDVFLQKISIEKEKPKRRIRPKFTFETISLVHVVAPDNLKNFDISEEYTNQEYIHTSGIMAWRDGGGSVLYFKGQGQSIAATWLDSRTLEIAHDKEIDFSMKKDVSFYCGDEVKVIYKIQ